MEGSRRDTEVKNSPLDYVGEGESGMIERIALKCVLPYVKQMTSASSMSEAGHPKPVLWDNPEGLGGDAGGRGVQDGGTHVYLWLIHVSVWQIPPQYCKVIILQLK